MDSLVIMLVVLTGITGFLAGLIVASHFHHKDLKAIETKINNIKSEPEHIIEIRDNRKETAVVDPFKPW